MVILIWLLTYFVCEVVPSFICLCIRYGWNIDYYMGFIFAVTKYGIRQYLPLILDILFVLLHSALFAFIMSKWYEFRNRRAIAKGKLKGAAAMYPACTSGGKVRIFSIHGIAYFANCVLVAFSTLAYSGGKTADGVGAAIAPAVFIVMLIIHIICLINANKAHREELAARQKNFEKLVCEAQERLKAKEESQEQ